MMQITEDTPPDMLAGAMDLTVHLPNCQPPVKMAVDRSTPMMDLLVQVTTAHRLQPSAHIIQALGYAPNQNQSDAILPYKPNTPIGALDIQHIKVIPKSPSKTLNKTSSLPNTNRSYTQPFESTFRLQVHLPRNQLYVVRVSQYVMLEDIMKKVCTEKNLDEKKYEFRHPGNLQEILDPKLTLSDYQLTEVSVVQKGRTVSTSDMAALQREEERRRQQSRSGGGVFNLIFKRGRTGVSTGSVSSGDTRSISPTRSDDSHTRSETPPALQSTQILQNVKQEQMSTPPAQDKPKVPLRKRRPAPKPPVQQQNNETTVPVQNRIIIKDAPGINNNTFNDNSNNKTQATSNSEKSITDNNGLTICHSRNSSDSSGYHEASILSDNFNTQTLSRRNKNNLTASTSNINQMGNGISKSGECSKSTSNLTIMENHSKSTSNLVTTVQRKKKAPPPPPVLKSSESTAKLEKQQLPTTLPTTVTTTAPVVASAKPIAPPVSDSITNVPAGNIKTPRISDLSMQPPSVCPSPPPSISPHNFTSTDLNNAVLVSSESTEKGDQMSATIEVKALTPPAEFKNSLPLKASDTIVDSHSEVMDMDWQYQLPSPPKAFRDSSPTNLTEITNYETVTLNGFKSDSTVVSTPELIEKLEVIRDNQTETRSKQTSETSSQISEDRSSENIGNDNTLLSGHLSLEELEKRKSQFLEKELASLNHEVIQKNRTHKISLEEITDQKRNGLLHELEGKLQNGNKTVSRNNSQRQDKIVQKESESILPNFKITTYNQSKKGINIFEDDSIRSNVENKTDTLKKETDLVYKQKKHSGISERDINVINAMNEHNNQKSFDKPNIISYREKSDNEIFKIPLEISKQKSSQISINGYNADKSVQRSDSFHSSKNDVLNGFKQNPVKRSVSHVSLDKYKCNGTDDAAQNPEPIRKTSSQWNVSDLQSLQVMRAILPKLTNSQPSSPTIEEPKVELKLESQNSKTVEPTSKEVKYRYSPPSINLSTWSERPKSQVSLKSDKDYRIGGAGTVNESVNIGSKFVNADNNSSDVVDSGKINIKINNNCEASSKISHHIDGNVVIKIGGDNECTNSNFSKYNSTEKSASMDPAAVTMRFIDHTTATGFKKTDYSYSKPPRPHSIAFDSYQDMSRVPIVRAVELKKSFRDPQTSGNKSITQIIPDECEFNKSNTLGRNVKNFHNSNDSLHLNGNNSNTLPYKSSLNSLGNKKRFSEIYNSSEIINITNEPKANNFNNNTYSDVYPTTDNVCGRSKYTGNENTVNMFGHKPIIKNNRISAPVPVVKGFRLQHSDKLIVQNKNENVAKFSKFIEKSIQNDTASTVYTNGKNENVNASKQPYSYAPKPFSQATLKKTVYSEKLTNDSSQNNSRPVTNGVNKFSTISSKPNNTAPVPPPPMPKVTAVMKKVPRDCTLDPRDQLLDAIRNFGGKSSLKPIK